MRVKSGMNWEMMGVFVGTMGDLHRVVESQMAKESGPPAMKGGGWGWINSLGLNRWLLTFVDMGIWELKHQEVLTQGM